MRWALLAGFLALVGASTWAGLREERELAVEIRTSYALPEWGDWGNVVRDRAWYASAEAVVRAPRGCRRVDVASERRRWRDGRVVGVSPWFTTARTGEPVGLDADGYAGDLVELVVHAACRAGPDAGLRGEATARFSIPRGDCRHRPLRVLEVRGAARVGNEAPVVGDEIPAGEPVDVVRGRIVVGAPECNGFHVLLRPGRTWVGGHDPNGRGEEFTARALVVMRADEHAGSFFEPRLGFRVEPQGRRCSDCALTIPASFVVRSVGRRAAVRAFASSVLVMLGRARRIRVRAGEQLFVDCTTRPCRVDGPVLFQPHEPFALERRVPRRLARMIPGRRRPPTALLVPERAFARAATIAAASGEPALVAAAWSRDVRTRPGADVLSQAGLVIWRREASGWRLAYARRFPWWFAVTPRPADVTRDGHAEVLITQATGSGGCGVRRVLGTVQGIVRELYRRNFCETEISAVAGDLQVELPIGPCPFSEASAHCYGGLRRERWRWNGRRLALHRVHVRCRLPRLDPARDCRARRR